jgi:hypothetical protein
MEEVCEGATAGGDKRVKGLPIVYFDTLGLLMTWRNPLEPPEGDPHVGWCGKGERATAPPMPIRISGSFPGYYLSNFRQISSW